jgi:hypothetical protein
MRRSQMGEIVGFVSKSERERLRLIREARAIYDSIFPPVAAHCDDRAGTVDATGLEGSGQSSGNVRITGRS